MASLTKIFTGMTGGPEAIQSNFTALNGETLTDTGLINTGVTQVNGVTPATQYRVWRFGNSTITFFTMYYELSADLPRWTALDIIKYPTANVFPAGYVMDKLNSSSTTPNIRLVQNDHGQAQFEIYADHITMRSRGTDLTKGDGFYLNTWMVGGTK